MGHMDRDNEPRHTVTVYREQGDEVFNGCTSVDANDRQLQFTDKNDKTHEFYGVSYHIAQE
jgi:hypothetical protein